MRGLMATIVPKRDMVINGRRHFTAGQQYIAMYEVGQQDQGWVVGDDTGAKHWLSPWDGKDHKDIHQEEWIVKNFYIVDVK